MSDFKLFKEKCKKEIIEAGLNPEHLYFSQLKDGYTGIYAPEYPEKSGKDIIFDGTPGERIVFSDLTNFKK